MLAAGRRTYLAMSVLAAMLAVTFVVYILLYRKLSPPRRAITSEADSSDSSDEEAVSLQVMVNGDCKKEEEEEDTKPQVQVTRDNMRWHIYKVRNSPFLPTSECC